MGYDEIIVVDSSGDLSQRQANEELCERLGVRYLYTKANRSEARNLGARLAKGSWILLSDDDISGSATFRRSVMDARAPRYDWLKAAISEEVTIFDREFFLRIGGYRPNLVLGEDDDLTARAFAQGKGGPIEGVFGETDYTPDEREMRMDFKRRLSNHIEYSLTVWEYVKHVERPARALFRWCLTVLQTGRRALQGDMRSVPYFLGAVGGLAFGLLLSSFRRPSREERAPSSPKA